MGAQMQNSPWIGVWECDNGDVFIGKYSQSIDYKYDLFYYDASVGAGWQIRVTVEEENGNDIESYMIDPDFDYDAAYYITLDRDTLTYTETFRDSPTAYTDMVFTKTGRTDVDAAWSEYWNK